MIILDITSWPGGINQTENARRWGRVGESEWAEP